MSSSSGSAMSDEAFSERVKKTFGNLFASLEPKPSPSNLSNPLWSLTGAEVEKKEWRRDKDTTDRDNNPCSSSFDDFVSSARKNSRKNLKSYRKELDDDDNPQDLDDDDDEEEEGNDNKEGLDDWNLRASIGLDSTLDNEEEEDTYDKVAIGRENAGDRLYMKDITGSNDSKFVCRDDILSDIGKKQRDPRANRLAARIRLKEDDAETATKAVKHEPAQASPPRAEKESSISARDGDNVKPILKRKERESTSKPSKRVRFDPGCLGHAGAVETVTENLGDKNPSEITTQANGSVSNEKLRQVPDYVQNPSKYRCYSFDSTDEMNEKSNTGAYMDFLEMVKKSKNAGSGSEQEDVLTDLPKSITFIPKKKSDTVKADGAHTESQVRESDRKQSSSLVGVASEEEQESEVGDMEIDEPKPSTVPDQGTTFRKQGRQYRSKCQADEPV